MKKLKMYFFVLKGRDETGDITIDDVAFGSESLSGLMHMFRKHYEHKDWLIWLEKTAVYSADITVKKVLFNKEDYNEI